jgi:rare lipoprotein A
VVETGLASWYGPPYAGRKGADGKVYDQNAMTAAHLTLPMGSTVRVTNLTTNQSAMVKITDRGPFVRGRIIDLSLAAAKATGLYRMGVAKVRVEAWTPGPSASPTAIPAVRLKNDLMRRYTTAKVIEFPGPTGHWVRINPARPDKSHATEVADSIHVSGAEPYLIRTD